jgi:hypothetical protein
VNSLILDIKEILKCAVSCVRMGRFALLRNLKFNRKLDENNWRNTVFFK